MATTKQLQDRLSELAAEAEQVRNELEREGTNKYARCATCSTRTKVGRLVYIQTHLRMDPYEGGGYWKRGEGQFDCPKCGTRNRLYDRPDVVALRRYFKEVVNHYHRQGKRAQ